MDLVALKEKIIWNTQSKISKEILWKEIMDYYWLVQIMKLTIVFKYFLNILDDEEFNNYVEIVKKYTKLEDNNLIYKILPIIDKLLNHRKMS